MLLDAALHTFRVAWRRQRECLDWTRGPSEAVRRSEWAHEVHPICIQPPEGRVWSSRNIGSAKTIAGIGRMGLVDRIGSRQEACPLMRRSAWRNGW